jgi:hypothetical protein
VIDFIGIAITSPMPEIQLIRKLVKPFFYNNLNGSKVSEEKSVAHHACHCDILDMPFRH